MSAQRLSPKSVRRIERSTGLSIARAWSHGGYWMAFVTDDHRHGSWNKKTGEWEYDEREQGIPGHPTRSEPHFMHYGGDPARGEGCEGLFGPEGTWPEDRR